MKTDAIRWLLEKAAMQAPDTNDTETAQKVAAAWIELDALVEELSLVNARCEILSDIDKARAEERRDTFAAAALTGLVGNPSGLGNSKDYATDAYRIADAMLKAREAK